MKKAEIRIVTEHKKEYMPLLLLGDEMESNIEKYIERGELFTLYDPDLKSVCVVTDEGGGTFEMRAGQSYRLWLATMTTMTRSYIRSCLKAGRT